MTTGWPRFFCSRFANGRKITSVSPPAAHGTMILMARSGYSARPSPVMPSINAAGSTQRKSMLVEYLRVISNPPLSRLFFVSPNRRDDYTTALPVGSAKTGLVLELVARPEDPPNDGEAGT